MNKKFEVHVVPTIVGCVGSVMMMLMLEGNGLHLGLMVAVSVMIGLIAWSFAELMWSWRATESD